MRVLFILLCIIGSGCSSQIRLGQPSLSGLAFERIILLVESKQAEKSMLSLGLAQPSDSVIRYQGEGTSGRVFQFRNGAVELLYLVDAGEAQLNFSRFGSDYARRWVARPWECGFGLGLVGGKENTKGYSPVTKVYRRPNSKVDYRMDLLNRIVRRPFVRIRKQVISKNINERPESMITRVTFTIPRLTEEQRLLFEHLPGVRLVRGPRCMATIEVNSGRQAKTLYLPTVSPARLLY